MSSSTLPKVALLIFVCALAIGVASGPEPAQAKKQNCNTEKSKSGSKTRSAAEKEKTCKENSETREGDERGQCQKESGAGEACCCGDEAGGDSSKGDNKKDDKKDDKGGGGGGSPQMPQIPQQKEKKDDSAKKEAERQQRIAKCKENVPGMTARRETCAGQFPYDPAHPVKDMKDGQERCVQDQIFQMQREINQCELNFPPGM